MSNPRIVLEGAWVRLDQKMRYRVYRMRDSQREQFRWAPHTGGSLVVKPKDYMADEELEAPSPYSAWKLLAGRGQILRPGDLVELINDDGISGQLQICKYIGFEPAEWFVAEPKTDRISVETERLYSE